MAKRIPWSEDEKASVFKHLGKYVFAGKLPGRKAIDECLRKESVLERRTWLLVKNFCRNKIESLKVKETKL